MMNSEDDYEFLFKIIVVGESGAGKSCFLTRFCTGEYTENYISTLGVDFKVKEIVCNDRTCKLQVWDTGGQDRYRAITRVFYRGADGAIVVFDITDRTSFEKLSEWINDLTMYAPSNIPLVLVGTKADMESKRAVPSAEAKAFADSRNLYYIETSARMGLGVEDAFMHLTEFALSQKMQTVGYLLNKKAPKLSTKPITPTKEQPCCSIM